MHSCKRDQLLTPEELAALRNLPDLKEPPLPMPSVRSVSVEEWGNGKPVDPVGYWRRQAEVEASNARDARMHVRQLRKEMAREEWRAFQFGWGLVLTWCVIIAMAWMGVV